jgi:DNA-binding MarR family transcriptional regulator
MLAVSPRRSDRRDRVLGVPERMNAHVTFVLVTAARLVRKEVERELAEAGLTWQEYLAMTTIATIDGLSQQTLRERCGLDRTTLSRALNSLDEMGLLDRERDRHDARRTQLHLSPEGARLLEGARMAVDTAEDRALRRLHPAEREHLTGLLGTALPPHRGLFG